MQGDWCADVETWAVPMYRDAPTRGLIARRVRRGAVAAPVPGLSERFRLAARGDVGSPDVSGCPYGGLLARRVCRGAVAAPVPGLSERFRLAACGDLGRETLPLRGGRRRGDLLFQVVWEDGVLICNGRGKLLVGEADGVCEVGPFKVSTPEGGLLQVGVPEVGPL